MAQYICTNFGNCSKANQIVTELAANPSCSECGTTLSPYTLPEPFWRRHGVKIASGVATTSVAALAGLGIFTNTLIVTPSTSGTITSEDKTINCGEVCQDTYRIYKEVKLTAQANPSFKFQSWKEGCQNPQEPVCKITLDDDKKIEAVFIPEKPTPSPLPAPHENELKADVLQNIKHYISEGMNEVKLAQIDRKNKKLHYNNAIIPFELAIKAGDDCSKFPELSAVYSNLGSSYLEIGKVGLAFERYQSALDCNPHDGLLQYNFASYYMNQKQEDLALEALEKSLELGVEKQVLDHHQSFCDFLMQDFNNFKEKSELKIVFEKYKVYCK